MKKLIALFLLVCIWLIYTTSSACKKKEECADKPTPAVDFYAEKTVVNPGDWVNFGYSGSDDVDKFQWSFTGGTPSSSAQRFEIVIYGTTGEYTVQLAASNDCASGTKVKEKYIKVIPYKDGKPHKPKLVNVNIQ